jgi:hypothetical protein
MSLVLILSGNGRVPWPAGGREILGFAVYFGESKSTYIGRNHSSSLSKALVACLTNLQPVIDRMTCPHTPNPHGLGSSVTAEA